MPASRGMLAALCWACVCQAAPITSSVAPALFQPSSQHSSRRLHVDMGGKCAVVAKKDQWSAAGHNKWDYHIKVYPWTPYGIVKMRIQPTTVKVKTIFEATILANELEGDDPTIEDDDDEDIAQVRVLTVQLSHKWQDDWTFDISGVGGPITSLEMSCSHMEIPTTDCPLNPEFKVINNYKGAATSIVHVPFWQVGAYVDISFHDQGAISQVWGAELVDSADDVEVAEGYATVKRFRLMKYIVGNQRDSFGFDVRPPITRLPSVDCTLKHDLSPPAPAPPPLPGLPPPFRHRIDSVNRCFLGGDLFFTKEPDPKNLGTEWEVQVTLDQWVQDIEITIDFVGSAWLMQAHPLEVSTIEPPDVLYQTRSTKHSVTWSLQNYPGEGKRTFWFKAFGRIDDIGSISCCCASPPPPQGNHISLLPDPAVGDTRLENTSPPPPFIHVQAGMALIQGSAKDQSERVIGYDDAGPEHIGTGIATKTTFYFVVITGIIVVSLRHLYEQYTKRRGIASLKKRAQQRRRAKADAEKEEASDDEEAWGGRGIREANTDDDDEEEEGEEEGEEEEERACL